MTLDLSNNQITKFKTSILPSNLYELNLSANLLTEFNPSIALPTDLENLYLYENKITKFNPSIALPSILAELSLSANLLTEFNPSIALPSFLYYLDLSFNLLTKFNPSITLPNDITDILISNNQIDLVGYTISEQWANLQSFAEICSIDFTDNIDSVNGTDLETILISKNCIVS